MALFLLFQLLSRQRTWTDEPLVFSKALSLCICLCMSVNHFSLSFLTLFCTYIFHTSLSLTFSRAHNSSSISRFNYQDSGLLQNQKSISQRSLRISSIFYDYLYSFALVEFPMAALRKPTEASCNRASCKGCVGYIPLFGEILRYVYNASYPVRNDPKLTSHRVIVLAKAHEDTDQEGPVKEFLCLPLSRKPMGSTSFPILPQLGKIKTVSGTARLKTQECGRKDGYRTMWRAKTRVGIQPLKIIPSWCLHAFDPKDRHRRIGLTPSSSSSLRRHLVLNRYNIPNTLASWPPLPNHTHMDEPLLPLGHYHSQAHSQPHQTPPATKKQTTVASSPPEQPFQTSISKAVEQYNR